MRFFSKQPQIVSKIQVFYVRLKGKTRPGRNSSPALLPGTAFEPSKTRYSIFVDPTGDPSNSRAALKRQKQINTGTC